MGLFSCLVGTQGKQDQKASGEVSSSEKQLGKAIATTSSAKGQEAVCVNVRGNTALRSLAAPNSEQASLAFIELVHLLSTAEGGWWSALSEGCQAVCDCLGAAHACVYVLSNADFWATTAACAGLGAAAAAGRAYSSDPRFNGSAPAVILRARKESPAQTLVFRTAGGPAGSGSAPAATSTSSPAPTFAPTPAPTTASGIPVIPGAGAGAGLSSHCSGETSAPSPSPSLPLVLGSPPHRGGVGGAGGGGASSSPDSGDLPGDWQMLAEEHGLTHFAAVAWCTEAGEPVGVLSLAAKGPSRPPGWTPEALHSSVGLMAPHIRRAQSVLASPALSQLHAAATFSDLVNAVAEAAVEAAAAVAYVRGQSRVAFIGETLAAAAVFQQQQPPAPEGVDPLASVPLLKVRRSSCEFVLMPAPAGLRKSATATTATFARMSMEGDGLPALTEAEKEREGGEKERERGGVATDGLKRESWGPNARPGSTANALSFAHGNASNCNASFTLSYPRREPCKGHTLLLHRTLLDEALSKQVAGLCIDDCQAYTVSMKAYPRDLILARGAVMPLSLALATTGEEASSRPRMALYITYGTCLPRAALQAVVQELQQLLQAVLPVIRAKVKGVVGPEYDYLAHRLQDANRLRGMNLRHPAAAAAVAATGGGGGDPLELDGGGPEEQRALSFILPPDGGGAAPSLTPSLRGGGGAAGAAAFGMLDSPSPSCAPPTPTAPPLAAMMRLGGGSPPMQAAGAGEPPPTAAPPQLPLITLAQLTGGGSQRPTGQSNAAASTSDAATGGGGGAGGAGVREPLEGDIDMDSTTARRRRGSAVLLGRLLGPEVAAGLAAAEMTGRAQSASETDSSKDGRLLTGLTTRSVSFHLEAAQAPRGASKLAPLIASMHDRLKAAQAVQMTHSSRSEARRQDLQSIKLLQEIGQGGYGTVYRGTYHGTEVAIKIIKQSRLAGVQSSSNLITSGTGLGLHKQNLHDAIELVASVSMSHTNIVQVPAYFMDVRLEKPDDAALESMDTPSESRPFRLRHSPSFMESPKAEQELHVIGEGAMALVLEYCDCGSLCDAILNRKFIERVTPKKPPSSAGSNSAAPPKTYLAINMRSVYLTLLEIALALRHMHSLALVHCDLKPQNVLLKSSPRDPRGFTAKLSDFGLAKMMAHDDEGQLVIDEAVASGTITHVAPEVLLGQKALGAAVDIYAFGILMYQVLCGVKVYDKMKSASVIANAVAHRFMRPQLPAWVPASYRSLAEACWSHKPSARPTADELVRHLEQAIESKRKDNTNSTTKGGASGGAGANGGSSQQQQQ